MLDEVSRPGDHGTADVRDGASPEHDHVDGLTGAHTAGDAPDEDAVASAPFIDPEDVLEDAADEDDVASAPFIDPEDVSEDHDEHDVPSSAQPFTAKPPMFDLTVYAPTDSLLCSYRLFARLGYVVLNVEVSVRGSLPVQRFHLAGRGDVADEQPSGVHH